MKNSATIESLKSMRFGAMAAELERQMQDPSSYAHMGFEERLGLLVDAEWNSRQNNKLVRCIRYARLPELLEELALAQAAGELKKAIKSYQKYDLLILHEWLIRCLTPQESYNLLELVEARCSKGAMIFCTQYEPGDWYERLHPNSEERSAIAEAILDRIVHEVLIDGKVSMRERHGLRNRES